MRKAYANNNNLPTDRLTPELLWSMGRIGSTVLSPDKTNILYTVTTYNISENSIVWLGGNKYIVVKDGKEIKIQKRA